MAHISGVLIRGVPLYTFFSSGTIVRRDSAGNFVNQGRNGADIAAYRGYALVAGRFLHATTRDYAVSLPRQNNYFGTVSLGS